MCGKTSSSFALASVLTALALNADISPERFEQLGLKTGDTVYVSPRRARVFVPEYVI